VTIDSTLRDLGYVPEPTDTPARHKVEAAVLQLLRTPPEALARSRRTRAAIRRRASAGTSQLAS
jgi:hypothetical protein